MDGNGTITKLSAVELRDLIASGRLKAAQLASAFVERVSEQEDNIHAWAWFDPDFVIAQAEELDARRERGDPIGPLHGIPVGIKDIIDTAGIPTENGTVIDAGRVPDKDAAVVEKLKAAGAVLMGKTVTTELALLNPSVTRNPVNANHTPGGSSSGSAAAVKANMVPLAIGTQTAGSVIRPASFCGVTGFKPTFGSISRRGVLTQAQSLDTIGVFANDVQGAALLAEVLFGYDSADKDTRTGPLPNLLKLASSEVPVFPVFAFVRTPYWNERAEPELKAALGDLTAHLGDQCISVDLPVACAGADEARQRIQFAELSRNFYSYQKKGADRLSQKMLAAIAEGSATSARDYLSALGWKDLLNAIFEDVFARCTAILTPAAPGAAPESLETTGDPVFNGLWTLCGLPAITIPFATASNGLPLGVQLIGRPGDDARLLRTANWLAAYCRENVR
jgi:Asp-tRNA(Asn)/Glu-tRNA(Gln) amidotransferase A subunit family amidase